MKVFIIAGEASGDQLGARLMADLRALRPDIQFAGIGGAMMAGQGLASLFPMQDLSLMGLAEVLPKIPHMLRCLSETHRAVRDFAPDVVVTIDVPDFSKRLARRLQPLRGAGSVRLVHYVAPTVWAWRAGRAKTMAALFDHLLCLLPFEPPYFEREGLGATFVGHPVAQMAAQPDAGRSLAARLGIMPDAPVLLLLPGSRFGEVKKLWPDFLAAFQQLKTAMPGLVAIVPTLPHLLPLLGDCADCHFLTAEDDKQSAFALAAERGGAIAASGTVSLELARVGCPHLVAYRMHPITYWLARCLVKLPSINMVNLLLGSPVVPELLQAEVTPAAIISAYKAMLQDREGLSDAYGAAMQKLIPPYDKIAAHSVLTVKPPHN